MSASRGCAFSLALAILVGAGLLMIAVLAVQGEVRLGGSDPPALRIWVVASEQNRGFGFSTARNFSEGEQLCVKTSVKLLLWESDGSISNITYCECRQSVADPWVDAECPQ